MEEIIKMLDQLDLELSSWNDEYQGVEVRSETLEEEQNLRMPEDESQFQPNCHKHSGNCAKEMEELRKELAQVKNSHHREMEKLREELSMEREKSSKLASSVADLERKGETLLCHLEKDTKFGEDV